MIYLSTIFNAQLEKGDWVGRDEQIATIETDKVRILKLGQMTNPNDRLMSKSTLQILEKLWNCLLMKEIP